MRVLLATAAAHRSGALITHSTTVVNNPCAGGDLWPRANALRTTPCSRATGLRMPCSRVLEMFASVELTPSSFSLPRFAPAFRGRVWSTLPLSPIRPSRQSRPLPRVCTPPRAWRASTLYAAEVTIRREEGVHAALHSPSPFCASVLHGGVGGSTQSMRAFWDLPSGETMVMSTPEAIT